MHLTSAEATLGGVALGAALTWGSNGLSQRRAGREAVAERRRDAYAAFILAFERVSWAWLAGNLLVDGQQTPLQVFAQASAELQETRVTVLLVGSEEAKKAAGTTSRQLYKLRGHARFSDETAAEEQDPQFEEFRAAGRAFITIAEKECNRVDVKPSSALWPSKKRRRQDP